MLTVKGIIKLDTTGLRVMFNEDFSRYYLWLIHRYYFNCIKLDRPKHGTHLSIVTKALHNNYFNSEYLSKYHNMQVELFYNPEDLKTGGRNFTNFWFPMEFELGTKIKEDLGIVESNFLGFHVVVGNDKNYVGYKSTYKSRPSCS